LKQTNNPKLVLSSTPKELSQFFHRLDLG